MTHETRKIERKLTLLSSQTEVWEAITKPENIEQWFGESAEFELKAGSLGWLGWEDHGQFAMRVESVNPESYFAWRWMRFKDIAFCEDESTLVEWQLTALPDGGTELLMTESGFKSPESRSDNVGGWLEELSHLQTFLSV